MSDRVQTVVKFLKWASFVIGLLIAAAGGGGTAVQYALSDPGAYSASDAGQEISKWSLIGFGTAGAGPALGQLAEWLVGLFVGWKAKRKKTPMADFTFVVGGLAYCKGYFAGRPQALAAVQLLLDESTEVYKAAIAGPPAPNPPAPAPEAK